MFTPLNDAVASWCPAMWIGRKVTALMWPRPWPLTWPHLCAWRASQPSSPGLHWAGRAAASQGPAVWFSELSFPGTVWPRGWIGSWGPCPENAGWTGRRCSWTWIDGPSSGRRELLCGWKQQRLVWNRLGAPPQSSVEATLNWRSDCTDSRRVNWTVAKWRFKPSVWGWGDGWNQLSWALVIYSGP